MLDFDRRVFGGHQNRIWVGTYRMHYLPHCTSLFRPKGFASYDIDRLLKLV